jgi:predicted transcriptional regulator with HTH domain
VNEKEAKMKGEKIAEVKTEADDVSTSRIQVLHSLRRSRVRTEVALYLYKIYPEASYPADNGATYYRLSERGKSLIETLNLVVPVVK